MLPPDLDSIVIGVKARYRKFVVDDAQGVAAPDLLSAEEQVGALVRTLGHELLQIFLDVRREQAKEARALCACGKPGTLHRTTSWRRETLFGPVVVKDPYVFCRTCGEAERPLHRLLGTDRETWSLLLEEATVDLVADEPAGKAVAKLARHHPGVEMDRTAALRMLHENGQLARDFIDEKHRAAVAPGAESSAPAPELEVQWDAGMVPVGTLERIDVPEGAVPELTPKRGLPKRKRKSRWEEAKLGLVQKPGEVDRVYSARPTSELDASFEDLHALACIKGLTEETQVRGLADGARHIRPRMEEAFCAHEFRFILDRPHCKEHLSDAAVELQAVGALAAAEDPQIWAALALKRIESGLVAEVVAELREASEGSGPDDPSRNDTLRREAAYFERNSDAVDYAEYRAAGWSTASSEVESGHRHVIQCRVKIAGAWWHPDNIGNILALRILKANGWWDEFWANRRNDWRLRAEAIAEQRPAA